MEKKLLKSLKNLRQNKKGILMGNVIFIILNITFILMLGYFVYNSASGAGMKQKVLAKEISMFIDSAKPGTTVGLNIANYKKIAEAKKIPDFIKCEDGNVEVALTGQGFSYPYFSTYAISCEYGAGFGDVLMIEVKS